MPNPLLFHDLYPRQTHCLQAFRDFYTQVFWCFAFLYPRIRRSTKTRKRNKHKALPGVVKRVEDEFVPTPLSCLKIVLQYAHFSSKNIQQKMFIAYIVLFGFKSFGVSIICQSENNPVVLYAIACTFYKMH